MHKLLFVENQSSIRVTPLLFIFFYKCLAHDFIFLIFCSTVRFLFIHRASGSGRRLGFPFLSINPDNLPIIAPSFLNSFSKFNNPFGQT